MNRHHRTPIVALGPTIPNSGAVLPVFLLDQGIYRQDALGSGLGGSATDFDHLGRSSATGDFDGDGFPDLVVGAPAADLEAPGEIVARAGGSLVFRGFPSSDGFETGNRGYWSDSDG